MTSMAPNLEYKIRIDAQNPYVFLSCTGGCKAQLIIHTASPLVSFQQPTCCPLCGAREPYIRTEWQYESLFQLIGDDFDLDEQTIEGLYDLWNPAGGDSYKFVDFVKSAIAGEVK